VCSSDLTGPAGAPGSGGGGGGNLNLGQGVISAVACEDDGKIYIDLDPYFASPEFTFGTLKVGDPTLDNGSTDGDISSTCAGSTITFYFKIKPSITGGRSYLANDVLTCSYGPLPQASSWPSTKWQFEIPGSTLCATNGRVNPVRLDQIFTADHLPEIGFDIGR
jgi:hypothetical protein